MNEESECEAVARLVRAAMSRLGRRLRAQDRPNGVGATGLSVLGRLFRDGLSSAGMLADAERLQPQSLTRVLRTLEERDLIVRTADPADRRRSAIAITPAGTGVLRESVRKRNVWLANAMAAILSPTERDLLRLTATLLDRLADREDET